MFAIINCSLLFRFDTLLPVMGLHFPSDEPFFGIAPFRGAA